MSPKWLPQVTQTKDKLFHAYAIHTNGKVEKEGNYEDKTDAILSASDLAKMLNLHHRYGGKYEGKDKLVGRKISQKEIDKTLKHWKDAFKKYMIAHNKIFNCTK